MQGKSFDLINLHDVVAAPLAAQGKSGNAPFMQLLFLGLIVVAFYFFMIRPQRNRQRRQIQMQNSVRPGQRVMTTAGLYATIVAVEDDAFVLEVAPGIESRYTKQAVLQVLDGDTEEAAEDDAPAAGAEETPGKPDAPSPNSDQVTTPKTGPEDKPSA